MIGALQDRLEQYTRKNSIEIRGVPESTYPSVEEVVFKLAEALKVPINPGHIEIRNQLNRKGNKPITVKFVSHKSKTRLYKAIASRVNLRNHSPEPKGRISTYENLTSYRKKIVNEAKGMRRNGELLKVCTIDGRANLL